MCEPPQAHDFISILIQARQSISRESAALYKNGQSLRAIAQELGVSKTCVREAIVREKVPLRRKTAIRNAPYGYSLVKGRLFEDPKEMSVVQDILKWWRQGMSHCAIARRLNDQKVKPRKATNWSQPTIGFIIERARTSNTNGKADVPK